MITEAILEFFRTVVQWVIDLMPDWGPPDLVGLLDSMTVMFGYLAWANKYAPLAEVGAIVAALMLYKVTLYVIDFAVWVLTKAHVLGGE